MHTAILNIRAAIALLIVTLALFMPAPADAAQGSLCMPTTGTVSGLTFSQNVNAALGALVTSNSGATAPTNPCGGVALTGQMWLDTSVTPNLLKIYDGTAWETLGAVDASTGRWTPPIGGGANSIASASSTNLWSVGQSYVTVTGTTTITALAVNGSGVTGSIKVVAFSGVLQLTYNATSLILPGAANITTQAGDKAVVVNLGGGNAAVMAYTRADGTPVAPITSFSSQVAFTGVITPTAISGTTNNWAPTGLAGATLIRATPSSTTSLTGLTAQPAGTLLMLVNISTSVTMTLVDESASSTAANRFALSADWPIGPEDAVWMRYDGTASRWIVLGAKGRMATQSEAETATDNYVLMTPLRVNQQIDAEIESGLLFVTRRPYYSDDTYTPNSGVDTIHVVLCGAGGGGGGADVPSGPGGYSAGGGGGGETIDMWLNVSSISPPVTIDIGTAGTGGTAGSSGSSGSSTSFGPHSTANGGTGGTGATTTGDDYRAGNGGAGGAGGTGSGDAFSAPGQPGGSGAIGDGGAGSSLANGTGGSGGSATLGGGGGRGLTTSEDSNANGESAVGFCGGGGGGVSFAIAGATGGNGGNGFLYVEEYRTVQP